MRLLALVASASALLSIASVGIAAGQNTAASFVVKDARDIEPNSVRFAAAQGTEARPNIVLFGGNSQVWPKIKGAAEQSAANGYPVRAILVGSPSAPAGLEIYAKGHHVTNAINPYSISQAELVRLIRDVYREHYGR